MELRIFSYINLQMTALSTANRHSKWHNFIVLIAYHNINVRRLQFI
jgi:hypothetical protein